MCVEFERNGSIVYRGMHAPTGLWNDGPSAVLVSRNDLDETLALIVTRQTLERFVVLAGQADAACDCVTAPPAGLRLRA